MHLTGKIRWVQMVGECTGYAASVIKWHIINSVTSSSRRNWRQFLTTRVIDRSKQERKIRTDRWLVMWDMSVGSWIDRTQAKWSNNICDTFRTDDFLWEQTGSRLLDLLSASLRASMRASSVQRSLFTVVKLSDRNEITVWFLAREWIANGENPRES